jgi:hypothetical protein
LLDEGESRQVSYAASQNTAQSRNGHVNRKVAEEKCSLKGSQQPAMRGRCEVSEMFERALSTLVDLPETSVIQLTRDTRSSLPTSIYHPHIPSKSGM